MSAFACDPSQVSAVAAAQSMGKGGFAFFDSSVPYTIASQAFPSASAILFITDTVLSVLTGNPKGFRTGGPEAGTDRMTGYANGIAIGSITFPAGLYLPGSFIAATVTSGTIAVYF